IYKYHHDGPTRDYGGLNLSEKKVMPYVDKYERFVEQRLGLTHGQSQGSHAAPAAAAAGAAWLPWDWPWVSPRRCSTNRSYLSTYGITFFSDRLRPP
ncbi:hypothetical protein, partial [Pandoraea apista]|uniref:hypothetical protein n=1 Tax=Pandoraea apista TaxID=93218 RepID=UPI001C8AC655